MPVQVIARHSLTIWVKPRWWWLCDYLAVGVSERAFRVLDWWSGSGLFWARGYKECQLSEFEADRLLWKASGVQNIDPQDGGFLTLTSRLEVTWLDSIPTWWLFLHSLPESFSENRIQTHTQTGYCANEYANLSLGTNTVHSNHNQTCCEPRLKGHWMLQLTLHCVGVLCPGLKLCDQFHGAVSLPPEALGWGVIVDCGLSSAQPAWPLL